MEIKENKKKGGYDLIFKDVKYPEFEEMFDNLDEMMEEPLKGGEESEIYLNGEKINIPKGQNTKEKNEWIKEKIKKEFNKNKNKKVHTKHLTNNEFAFMFIFPSISKEFPEKFNLAEENMEEISKELNKKKEGLDFEFSNAMRKYLPPDVRFTKKNGKNIVEIIGDLNIKGKEEYTRKIKIGKKTDEYKIILKKKEKKDLFDDKIMNSMMNNAMKILEKEMKEPESKEKKENEEKGIFKRIKNLFRKS